MIMKLINTILNTLYNSVIGGLQIGNQITTITSFINQSISDFTPLVSQGYGFLRTYMPDITIAILSAFILIDITFYAVKGILAIFRFIKSYVPIA